MSRINSWGSTVSSAFDPERTGAASTGNTTTTTTDDEDEVVPPLVAVEPGTSSELFNLFATAAANASTDGDPNANKDRNAWLGEIELPTVKVEYQDE